MMSGGHSTKRPIPCHFVSSKRDVCFLPFDKSHVSRVFLTTIRNQLHQKMWQKSSGLHPGRLTAGFHNSLEVWFGSFSSLFMGDLYVPAVHLPGSRGSNSTFFSSPVGFRKTHWKNSPKSFTFSPATFFFRLFSWGGVGEFPKKMQLKYRFEDSSVLGIPAILGETKTMTWYSILIGWWMTWSLEWLMK